MMDMYEMRKAMEIIQNYTANHATSAAFDTAYEALNTVYAAMTARMEGGRDVMFTLDGTTYRTVPSKKGGEDRYFKNEDGKTRRIGLAEYGAAFNRWTEQTIASANVQGVLEAIEEIEKAPEQQDAPKADLTPEQVKEALEEAEESVNTEEVKRIARRARAKKVRVGGMEFNENGVHVVLTAKQIDFIRHLPDTTFWERGVDSLPWIDCLCDDIGGQFENKPMTVGAMVSTLREKGLLETGVTTINKRKSKYFRVTEIGKVIFRKILND